MNKPIFYNPDPSHEFKYSETKRLIYLTPQEDPDDIGGSFEFLSMDDKDPENIIYNLKRWDNIGFPQTGMMIWEHAVPEIPAQVIRVPGNGLFKGGPK